MDKKQQTIDLIKALHQYQDDVINDADFIAIVCQYFDFIKQFELSQYDLQFLKKIANTVGIPHYFDHLKMFKHNIEFENYSLDTLSSQIYESTLYTDETSKLHKYQKQILSKFIWSKNNRYFLSASTSFGKTHLVYEVLKKMNYKNIVLLFPTIALLNENLEKIYKNSNYQNYNVHTLSDVSEDNLVGSNIFIYTPERFLSFIEKQAKLVKFDFIFIDEVYKIDNEYIIEEQEAKENERDVSYRIAAYYSVMGNSDILLAGPYIEKYSTSFERFLNDNRIEKINFNQYEIVGKTYNEIKGARNTKIEDGLSFTFSPDEKGKFQRLTKVVNVLCNEKKENCIIYCSTPHYAEKYASNLPKLIHYDNATEDFHNFVMHIEKHYGNDWIVTKALKKGIGVHHGLVPKYIQKDIIYFFNLGTLKVVTSTTTITEGVNTSAKNLIVTNNKKGDKPLKRFDAKNIAGRAGRFDSHYNGRVIVLMNKFLDDVNKEKESINHKNYDLLALKDEIDLFHSADEFLTQEDINKRNNIVIEQKKRNIPDHILDMYRVVSKKDKILLYDNIQKLSSHDHQAIRELISRVNNPEKVGISWDGFEVLQKSFLPILKKNQLEGFINARIETKNGTYSLLTIITDNYLKSGFMGLVNYKRDKQGKDTNTATREAARFVYNTAKYQLVKHLGVFNIMYKFYRSINQNIEFENVSGIDRLLTKLEYNALTEIGRKVSDYGVPEKVLRYYEADNDQFIKSTFDTYEQKAFNNVDTIVNK